MFANVLVEYGAKMVDKTFTYIIPDKLKSVLKTGMKVKIPFGKNIINGFVLEIINECNTENLKEIIDITDSNFVLNEELLKLGKIIQNQTLCSLISAYQTMLPSSMKVKTITSNYQKYNEYLEIKEEKNAIDYINNNTRKIKRIELINRLLNKEKVLKKEYNNEIIKELLENNIISINKENIYRINKDNNKETKKELTRSQQRCVDEVINNLNTNNTYLLYGVTGSGKTEVYMQIIEEVVKQGKCAILLVPEISLTHQIVKRLYDRFASDVAIFHSALSEGEKYDEYHKILNGDVHVVVGTRSAIFVPFEKIGVIILDEEQSQNYKQDNNPRYHARDIALERAKYHNCPLILGSATPSLESMARSKKGVYILLELKERIGKSVLPEVTVIDMQEEYKKRNMIISDYLDEKIKDRISKNEQVILMLNRRGYSTIINCKNCGYTFKCPNCEITLTYHKTNNNLRCHYCGYTLLSTEVCPSCHEKALSSLGLGTEKLEEELIKRYNVPVIRMDTDTTSKKGSQDEIIKKIENREVSIIVGTQMISKGFDFPYVTLVGIINADDSLNIPDFRSGEKTFELLTQTIGRAGRGNIKGEAVIQTFNYDNKTIEFSKNNNYEGLYNYEMNIRKILKYPPYFYITMVKIASKDYNLASKEITKVRNYLDNNLKDVIILGPTTASMFKINNVYRFQIILKYKNYDKIKNSLIYLDNIYKTNSKVNIEIDNNPVRI